MRRNTLALALVLLAGSASPAPGQFLFRKAARPAPAQRVPELILALRTDADDRKRAAAAEELRDFDTRAFTEIVPVLQEALKNDKSVSVRLEAVTSLARIRPVNQAAGQALDSAAANDESLRVRLHAKSVLIGYHLAGYSPQKGLPAAPAATAAAPAAPPAAPRNAVAPRNAAAPAYLTVAPAPAPGPDVPRRLPSDVTPASSPPPAAAPARPATPPVDDRPF